MALVAVAVGAALLLPPTQGRADSDLQSLIDAAPAGSTLRVPPGSYSGGVVVAKPLRLEADGDVTVDGGGRGTVLAITAPDVAVTGLRLRGSGTSLNSMEAGVKVTAPRVRLEHNRIEDALFGMWLENSVDSVITDNTVIGKPLELGVRGDGLRIFGCDRCVFERNSVRTTRDTVIWYSKGIRFDDNEVIDSRYGMHFMFAEDTTLTGNRFTDNSVGVYVMNSQRIRLVRNLMARNVGPSGDGLGLKDTDGFEAEGNRILANRIGIYIDNSPTAQDITHTFTENMIAFNEIGIQFLPSVHDNVFSRNVIVDNAKQVSVEGGGAFRGNTWVLDGAGNHWGDYAGFDADGDGVGDIPFRIEDLFGTLTDRSPELNLFTGTPAARAMDLAAKAFPVLRPDPRVVDDAPLVASPPIPPVRGAEEPSHTAWTLIGSLALLAAAAALIVFSGAVRVRPSPRRRSVEAPA